MMSLDEFRRLHRGDSLMVRATYAGASSQDGFLAAFDDPAEIIFVPRHRIERLAELHFTPGDQALYEGDVVEVVAVNQGHAWIKASESLAGTVVELSWLRRPVPEPASEAVSA